MIRKRKPKRRSPAARALASPLFRVRIVRPLKGKASYRRRPRHQGGAFAFETVCSMKHDPVVLQS